jgi:hypothetical protein
MKECCIDFFKANDLQNICNGPLQHCGYCGRKLTTKEFLKIKNEGPDPEYQKVAQEKAGCRNSLRRDKK